MSFNNKKAFENFSEFLDTRQKETVAGDLDIREKILSLRSKNLSIGFNKLNLEQTYAVNMRNLFPYALAIGDKDWSVSKTFLASGIINADQEISHKGGGKIFELDNFGQEIILLEQGFLASTHSWSHAFRHRNPKFGCLGYVYDDIAHYFMADYPNRLIHKLNSDDELSTEEMNRARGLIDRIVANKISKYNAQPIRSVTMSEGYDRRVLVIDQNFQDASTIYGKLDETVFEEMLLAAIRENPDAEILIKAHPDTAWEKGKRIGYYTHLRDEGRIRILRDPINPFVLFDQVDTVYIGSSQMGLEALFAGKKVVCFGVPFFSGWGFTDDRQDVPHRHRGRTLEEIFYYFYVWYTIYHVPELSAPSEIEDVLDFLEINRPVALPADVEVISAPPRVSIILPVYGVENEIRQCIESIQRQTLREIEIITVNDCSPDGSQAIIDELAADDHRIRPIVLEENIGQGFARNRAMDVARGEYIWFLDSDDFFAIPTHLETVYSLAKKDDCDMVRGRKLFERVEDEHGKFLKRRRDPSEIFYDEELSNTTFSDSPVMLNNRHFWTWLYKREFLDENDIRFINTQWEERPFLVKALVNAKSVSTSSSEAVIYRVRQSSTARRPKNARDYTLQMGNFEEVIGLLIGDRPFDRDHPYFYHVSFNVSQFLHYIFRGFIYQLIEKNEAADTKKVFFARLKRLFKPLGLKPDDITSDPIILSRPHVNAHAYKLIYASIMADRLEFVDQAINLEPVDQQILHEIMAEAPATKAEANFQDALNMYARNELVKPISEADFPLEPLPPESSQNIRVILHVGSTKTGSTYLQHLMEQNRPALLRKGIWYPEVGLFWQQDRPHKQAGHAGFAAAAVHRNDHLRKYLEHGLQYLAKLGISIHTIVLSSEAYFLNEKAPALVDYFQGYDTRMIVYLRRQDEWANSQYAEFVGGGAVGRISMSIEDWLQQDLTKRRLNYFGIVEHWAEKLDRKQMIIRPFEKSQFVDNDLVADFAASVDLPQLLDLPKPKSDKTNIFPLENAHIHILQHFNTQNFHGREYYFKFIDDVTKRLIKKRETEGKKIKRPWLLTSEQSADLLATHAESNAMLAQDYLGRSDGLLFENNSPRVVDSEADTLDLAEYDLILEAFERNRGKPPAKKKPANKKPVKPGPQVRFNRHYKQACTAFHNGRFAGALKQFNEARKLQPNNAHIRRCMAETLIKLDRRKDAVRHLEKAHQLVPDNMPVKRRLKQIKYSLFGLFSKGKPFPVPKP